MITTMMRIKPNSSLDLIEVKIMKKPVSDRLLPKSLKITDDTRKKNSKKFISGEDELIPIKRSNIKPFLSVKLS